MCKYVLDFDLICRFCFILIFYMIFLFYNIELKGLIIDMNVIYKSLFLSSLIFYRDILL